MANVRWFLLNVSHPGFKTVIDRCRNQHEKVHVGAKLSVNVSNNGTRALVKVDGAGKAWRRGKFAERIGGIMFDVFDRDDHHRAVTIVKEAGWEPPLDALIG